MKDMQLDKVMFEDKVKSLASPGARLGLQQPEPSRYIQNVRLSLTTVR